MSRQRGLQGFFRPFQGSAGDFSRLLRGREEAKDEYSGSSQIRFPFSVSRNTGWKKLDALLLSPRVTFVTRRCILRSFFRCSNVSTPESLRDVEIYNSTGDGMYPVTFIKSFIHLLIHRQMLSNTFGNGTNIIWGNFGESVSLYYHSCSKVKVTLL